MQLNFRKQDFYVVLFPDANDLSWGGFRTQVPHEDLFSYVVRHIPSAENHWGDFLSRLQSMCG